MPPHLENNLIKMCICCKFVCENFETWFWERLNYQWEEDREVTTLSSYVRGHHVYKNVWDPWSEKHRLPLGVCQHSRSLCGGCHLNSHGAWSIWTQQCRHDSRTSTAEKFLPVFAVPSTWRYTHGIYSVPRPTHHTFRVHSIYNLAVTLVLVGLSRLFVLVAIKNLPATTVRA